jgi:uncharacterized protein YheU (UPF0270 family)
VIEIPVERLSADVLTAIIEEFILREGTDYGAQEAGMDNKIAQVRRQLELGKVLITFDPATENCTLLTQQQYKNYEAEGSAQQNGSQSPVSAYEDYSQDMGNNLD